MLRDILRNLQDTLGVGGDRARLVAIINQAYREYFNRTDLPGSLMEQTFEFDPTEQLVTLPWHVGEVRGMRRYYSNTTVNLLDSGPRFHTRPWRQPMQDFHIIGRRAIHTPLSVESQITVTAPIAQTVPFSVTIRGQTAGAASISETLNFAPGDLSKTTTTQFAKDNPNGIQSIVRDGDVTADLIVTDGAGVEICLIPNSIESPQHIVIQWHDAQSGQYSTTDTIIEVLYKRLFIPLTEDSDEAVFPAIENALVWKARSYFYSLSKDELAGAQSVAADQKADQLYKQAIEGRGLETIEMARVAANPYERAWSLGYPNWGRFR